MKRKLIVALIATLSINLVSDNIVSYAGSATSEMAVVVEGELYAHEVEIIVDWLEAGVNTPQEIAERYKNPTNRYNILQTAIRRNVPIVSALTEAFYGTTNGVLPGGVNSNKVIKDPAVTVPSNVPAVPGVSVNTAVSTPALVTETSTVNSILPGEEEYQQGLAYDEQKNDVEAFFYYKQAADKMHPKAACKVAWMYYDGRGTSRNRDTALAYLKISANGGYVWGEYDYAWMLLKHEYDKKEGLLWMQKAAEHKNPRACYQLGEGYRNGYVLNTSVYEFIERDDSKAIDYYRKARETNTAEGYYYWGLMYFEGNLNQKNYAEAAKWFTKAMDMGYEDAKKKLINIYNWGGYGIDKNPGMVSKLEGKM